MPRAICTRHFTRRRRILFVGYLRNIVCWGRSLVFSGVVLSLFSTAALALLGSTTTLTSSANPSAFGQSVTFTATVTGLVVTPTGTVTFKDGATTLGTGTVNASGQVGIGQATFTTSALTGGSHAITAVYGGDIVYNASTPSVLTQTVNPNASSTSITSSINPSAFGQSVSFTATVTGPGGTPTGTVTFKDGATTLGTGTLNGSGQATFATSALTSGSHAITAVYGGDTNFNGSTSSTLTQTINPNASSTSVTSSANPSAFGQSVTFTATVTGPGGTPTGAVTFKDGSTTLGTGTLNGSGQTTFATSALAVGSHAITAVYGGDTNFSGGTSSTLMQTVNQNASTTSVTSSINPSSFGQSVTFTATVTGSGGPPTGTVTFKDGATTLGTGPLNGSGQATFATNALTGGSHAITAVYGGGINFSSSTSSVLMQAVDLPSDSVKLRNLQLVVTKIVAQSSGQAISGAIEAAIGEGFSEHSEPIAPSSNGLRFNLVSEEPANSRVANAFEDIEKPKKTPTPPAKDLLVWADVRGTGWTTSPSKGDINGGQVNALAGVTSKLTTDLLIGAFTGYETFAYSSLNLSGRLKGDGWTAGGYVGWRFLPNLLFSGTIGHSNLNYGGTAGLASGSFPGDRWLATGGLTGRYKFNRAWEIEPSARAYALWENEKDYIDNLGTMQPRRTFMTGRASVGIKSTYWWAWSNTLTAAPYVGVYADYYFTTDNATVLSSIPEFVRGLSARVDSGLSLKDAGGATFALGGELGGLGSGNFKIWSMRARAAIPF